MVDEMIGTVRAALATGADAATKQQAATILRGLLAMLESGGAAVPVAPPAPPFSGASDVLAAIVESVRPLLPAETLAAMPRFKVPLIRSGG